MKLEYDLISGKFQRSGANMVRIYERNGGKCWKIYAPGESYTMLSRRTEQGAKRRARELYPDAGVEIIYL